jgi:hypothetical protein
MSKEISAPTRREDADEALLADLRAIIAAGRSRAAVAVNAELVLTYWQIGERIVREEQQGQHRAAYGTQLLARIGQRLQQEFGRAFNERNLQQMRQFSLTYPNPNAVRSELTWTHYRRLMQSSCRSSVLTRPDMCITFLPGLRQERGAGRPVYFLMATLCREQAPGRSGFAPFALQRPCSPGHATPSPP